MGELSEALGRPTRIRFGTAELDVAPLDFNDLCDLEERSGISVDTINLMEYLAGTKNRRFFLWLVLRKADPSLSEEDRDAGRYRMTEMEAGRLIRFGSDVEQLTLINAALGISGLMDRAEDEAGPKPEPETPPATGKARSKTPKADTAPSA